MFEISEASGVCTGTKIILHLKEDCKEFASEERVKGESGMLGAPGLSHLMGQGTYQKSSTVEAAKLGPWGWQRGCSPVVEEATLYREEVPAGFSLVLFC